MLALLSMSCATQKPNTINKRLFKKELKEAAKNPIATCNPFYTYEKTHLSSCRLYVQSF